MFRSKQKRQRKRQDDDAMRITDVTETYRS